MVEGKEGVSPGGCLRALRLRAGASLEEMARATRISPGCLKALEANDFSELPAPVFVKGFIRAYCDFLGAPSEEALALYQVTLGGSAAPKPHALPEPPRASRISHPIAVSGILVILFGGGLLALNMFVSGGPKRVPEPQVTQVTTVEPPPPPPVSPSPVLTSTPSEAQTSPAQRLVVKAVEATWIRVQTDDGRVAEELLTPGATREWISGKQFLLTVGNAGGVQLELNGRRLPALGARGAVIRRLSLPEPPAGS